MGKNNWGSTGDDEVRIFLHLGLQHSSRHDRLYTLAPYAQQVRHVCNSKITPRLGKHCHACARCWQLISWSAAAASDFQILAHRFRCIVLNLVCFFSGLSHSEHMGNANLGHTVPRCVFHYRKQAVGSAWLQETLSIEPAFFYQLLSTIVSTCATSSRNASLCLYTKLSRSLQGWKLQP